MGKNKYLKVLSALIILTMTIKVYSQPRIVLDINDAWIFKSKEISGDSIKKIVTLPHTWNASDALNGFDYYRGKGIYSKVITIDKKYRDKRFFLKFEGVQSVADVFWNGKHLGQHRGGYSAFVFEVTSDVRFDSANNILVKADNSKYDDILPLGGDFNIYGGIYRPVSLIITDKISIFPLDHASPGVYLTQKKVTREEAQIEASVVVSNGYSNSKSIIIITTISDEKGQKITSVQTNDNFSENETRTVRQKLSVQQPHLWNGRKDPYMYHCSVQLIMDGRIKDEIIQPLGLRFFNVDADKGFFLNGTHLSLHGVSRHQENEEHATALTKEDHRTDIGLICEMGANAIRLSHYQQAEYFYTLCDSSGIVVWSEIPFVGSMMGGYTNSDAFRENAKQQLTELIRQNYNHPSICFWGIFNELSNSEKNSPFEIVTALNALAKKEDSTRITTAASFLPDKDPLNFMTSVTAWNKYFGWYYGKPEMTGKWADNIHKTHPALKLGISEYGAGGDPFQHSETKTRPFPFFHYWHPEEYQAECHEKYWAEIAKRPFIWGSFIWNMFDFGVASRDEGGTPARNNKGMVTYDRKTKKDVFYFYKANWNPDPMVYITDRRFIHRDNKDTFVKVYSNADKVELFVNGVSKGAIKGNNAVFIWNNIVLQKGNNSIKAIGENRGSGIEDHCIWYYKNNSAVNALIWFLRIGIKPFIVLSIMAMAFIWFKGIRHHKKGWKRRALVIIFIFLAILILIILAALIIGKMNYMNIFDYSII